MKLFGFYFLDSRKFHWLVPHWESFRIGVHILVPVAYFGPYIIARRRK